MAHKNSWFSYLYQTWGSSMVTFNFTRGFSSKSSMIHRDFPWNQPSVYCHLSAGGTCRAGSQAHFVATGDRLWQILVLSAASLFVTWSRCFFHMGEIFRKLWLGRKMVCVCICIYIYIHNYMYCIHIIVQYIMFSSIFLIINSYKYYHHHYQYLR